MKRTYHFCIIAALFLMAFLLAMNGVRRQDEALAARVAPEILRFHVLANSNTLEDQELKLAVKDFLLQRIQNDLAEEANRMRAAAGPSHPETGTCSYINKDMTEQYMIDNKSTLETMAELYIEEMGFDYSAAISLETCEFPQKTYGDLTFPAGTYDAVRVRIGDGAGENFWCVLYPSLCYLDSTYAVVPDDSKELLRALLPEEDFHALLTARRTAQPETEKAEQDSLLPRLTVRFKFAELFSH